MGNEVKGRKVMLMVGPGTGVLACLFLLGTKQGDIFAYVACFIFAVYWAIVPGGVVGYTGAIYGRKTLGKIWGLATMIVMGIGPFLGSFIGGWLKDVSGSYTYSIYYALGSFVLSVVLATTLPLKAEPKVRVAVGPGDRDLARELNPGPSVRASRRGPAAGGTSFRPGTGAGGDLAAGAEEAMANGDTRGLVFDIQGHSVHDGPGTRTTVFLNGCPSVLRLVLQSRRALHEAGRRPPRDQVQALRTVRRGLSPPRHLRGRGGRRDVRPHVLRRLHDARMRRRTATTRRSR